MDDEESRQAKNLAWEVVRTVDARSHKTISDQKITSASKAVPSGSFRTQASDVAEFLIWFS